MESHFNLKIIFTASRIRLKAKIWKLDLKVVNQELAGLTVINHAWRLWLSGIQREAWQRGVGCEGPTSTGLAECVILQDFWHVLFIFCVNPLRLYVSHVVLTLRNREVNLSKVSGVKNTEDISFTWFTNWIWKYFPQKKTFSKCLELWKTSKLTWNLPRKLLWRTKFTRLHKLWISVAKGNSDVAKQILLPNPVGWNLKKGVWVIEEITQTVRSPAN